jgi:serine/threonine-protein kinase
MSQRDRFFLPRADRRLGNRYELLECLGDGSYGWVWRAQKLEDDRIVAIKIPKEQGAKNEDLMEGSALVNREPHPNVVRVYWMGRVPPEREWYAIEMEYFPSVTLARLLDDGDQGFVASYERVLGIYAQVLAGVAHLHSFGICHGDIKPQNILVSGDLAKLTDFGSSVLPEEMYVRGRENGGTVLYSAPEVVGCSLRGRPDDCLFKADIYSLGVLLYQLVTATLPHDTYSQVARHTPFPRPREINTTVSPALEDFTLRCLARDPAARWSSVAEMIGALEHVRLAQLQYNPVRPLALRKQPVEDWSSQALRLLDEGAHAQAEALAGAEFEASCSPHAFLVMVSAAARDGRYFDCVREIEAHAEMIADDCPVGRDVRRLALAAYLETRQVNKARRLVDECIAKEGASPNLLFKKASLLGLLACYDEASAILLQLNRDYPRRPAVLKRLVLVYEQLRDVGKAAAFLRAYARDVPDDPWGKRKQEEFAALGLS